MRLDRWILAASTAALIAAGASMAGEIYKWTDEQGNVHYEDRLPAGGEDVQHVDILSRNTDSAAVQARVEAAREARADRAKAAADAAAAAESTREEDPDADPAKRAEKCQMYRDRLESFLRSQRLYTQDANGERKYLDESATMAARQKAQEQVEKYCGS
jgi:hypothetical protein